MVVAMAPDDGNDDGRPKSRDDGDRQLLLLYNGNMKTFVA